MSKKMGWIRDAAKMREKLQLLKRKRAEEEEGIRPLKRSKGSVAEGESEGPVTVKIKASRRFLESRCEISIAALFIVGVRRVEEEFKWKMQSVYKKASRGNGKKRKAMSDDDDAATTNEKGKGTETLTDTKLSTGKGKTEFEKRVDRRSVNDIAEAPPTLSALPRGAGASAAGKSVKASVESKLPVSAAQKRMMEEEREKAIERYRELKKLKLQQKARSAGPGPGPGSAET
ncbi:hypothetical protein FRB90_012311 [Tulasnella sp. 427]|nr:hypothetical protein FRB90_012311 [Tulasnella sp. 427]